jgi:hypothetical protein
MIYLFIYYYYYTYAWLNKKRKYLFLLINKLFQGGFNGHNKKTLLSQRRDVDEILQQVQPRNQVPLIAFILARGRHVDKYPPSQLPSENREPDETVVRPTIIRATRRLSLPFSLAGTDEAHEESCNGCVRICSASAR